nr:ribonuclease H-like domain-containing protein [Tanacetum cinerariifolium]
MAGKESSQPPQPPIASTKAPQMVSFVKLPILKNNEYILWTIKMEQYLAHIDYALWQVILNGNSVVQMTKDEAASTSIVRKVNAARQIMNDIRPRDNLFKSHSPIRSPFNRITAPKANFSNHKVNIVGDKTVSADGSNWKTIVKASAGCN